MLTETYGIIDSHAHLLHMSRKGLDVRGMLSECFSSGFSAIVDVGVDLEDSAERSKLASGFSGIYRSEGLYPSQADREDLDLTLERLSQALRAPGVIAVGEIGIDYHWNYATPRLQQDLFRRQLQLAGDSDLPVIVHNREAGKDILEAIVAARLPRHGVMHCFSEDIEYARSCLDAGFFLSFAGNVTFKNSATLREVVRFAPSDRLLIETDAPYLSPHPRRGVVNHPGLILHTYELIASERGISVQTLADTVRANFSELFGIGFAEP